MPFYLTNLLFESQNFQDLDILKFQNSLKDWVRFLCLD
jgi:hypothetical protein